MLASSPIAPRTRWEAYLFRQVHDLGRLTAEEQALLLDPALNPEVVAAVLLTLELRDLKKELARRPGSGPAQWDAAHREGWICPCCRRLRKEGEGEHCTGCGTPLPRV